MRWEAGACATQIKYAKGRREWGALDYVELGGFTVCGFLQLVKTTRTKVELDL